MSLNTAIIMYNDVWRRVGDRSCPSVKARSAALDLGVDLTVLALWSFRPDGTRAG